MGKINLLVANANQHFTVADIRTFRKATQDAEKYISNHSIFDYEVDVIITTPSYSLATIPEDGIGGRTYNSHLIMIAIDKEQTTIEENAVFGTLCHEMSHSLRWEKHPEYAATLFDGIILEGLAICLEEEAIKDTGRKNNQFFLKEIQHTPQAAIDAMISTLKDRFDDEDYDYDVLFYTGNAALPRWTGYKLGYYFVKKQLEATGYSVLQLTTARYDSFFRP